MASDRRSPAPRRAHDRLDDHAAIDHLADELLPALVAKLGASGLGELEIREGTWRVRLRMPADGNAVAGRRPASGRTGSRAGDTPHAERARADAPGAAGTGAMPVSPATALAPAPAVGPSRLVATSPAVGYFRPRGDLSAGTKVRAGDRIASVDVLGIGQDVVAPEDGLIGATLVEPGEPVEYGQAVIVLEQLTEPRLQPLGAPGVASSAADTSRAFPPTADLPTAATTDGVDREGGPAGADSADALGEIHDQPGSAAPDATPALHADTEPDSAAEAGPDASQPTGAD
jgi:acetyl-CoA carboxylase biotin carboxyl carrier protein